MDALSSKDINSGFLNRQLLLSTGDAYTPKKILSNEIDQTIIDRLELISQIRIANIAATLSDSNTQTVMLGCERPFIPITPDTEAMAILDAFDARMDKLC